MKESIQLTNDIVARHQLFGDLSLEAVRCYEDERFTAALACLFVLTESALKYQLQLDPEDNWGLYKAIEESKDRNLITDSQSAGLHLIREARNKLFHEDSYSNALEIAGTKYLLSEPETKQILFEMFHITVLKLVRDVVTR